MSASGLTGRGAFMKSRTDQHLYQTDHAPARAAIDQPAVKNGDEVLIRVSVTGSNGPDLVVQIPSIGGSPHIAVSRACVVEHKPAPEPLKVGDDVIAPDGNGHGVIRALSDNQAWVRFAPCVYFTYDVARLQRAIVIEFVR